MMKVLVVLMLVCAGYAEENETLSNQQPSLQDVHAALREITASLAETKLEVKYLPAENKELAAKLDKLEDQQTEVEKLKKQLQELAAKLEDQQTEVEKLNETLQEQAAKLDKLEDHQTEFEKLNATLQEQAANQQTEVDELKKQLQSKQVAFSASLVASGSQTFGPINRNTLLVFKRVVTNIGNAYSPVTGAFTAPLKGAYHFEWHVFGRGGHNTAAYLVKNSENIFVAYELQPSSGGASASNGASLLLEAGDVVSVLLYSGATVFDNTTHHTTFSGHMLFTM